MRERRNKINRTIDAFEQSEIINFDVKLKNIEKLTNVDIKILNEAELEVKRLATVLVINKDKATNTQFFLASNEVKNKQIELDGKVNELTCGGIKTLEWKLVDVQPEKCLPVGLQNAEIILKEKPFQTEIESFKVLIEITKDKKPFFVDVIMLVDGRVLILDQTQSLLRLLTNNQELSAQKPITNAKHIAVLNKDMVVVCLNESKTLKFLKVTGTDIVHDGEIKIDAECFGLSKYKSSVILMCATDKNADKLSIEPSEVKFKLLGTEKTLVDFNFPMMHKISPWRGFVFDEHSDRFVAISKDGSSLIWLDRSGQIIQENKFDSIGRGGLSGLAVDCEGRLYTAATRKVFEIANNGQILGTFPATINIYSIAVSELGDKLIAVGHNASLEVFMISHID